MAAITGMLARLVCWSIGNASLSLPALPRCWLRFPTRSQDFSCCSLLGSHPVGQGERWRESCPAAGDGWHGRGPQPWHRGGWWQAFNNKSVKKATFLFFPLSRRKQQENWRSCYYGMALPPSVPSTIQHQQPSFLGLGGNHCSFPLQHCPSASLSHVQGGLARAHRACLGPRTFWGPSMPARRAGEAGRACGVGTDAAMGFGVSLGWEDRSHLWM